VRPVSACATISSSTPNTAVATAAIVAWSTTAIKQAAYTIAAVAAVQPARRSRKSVKGSVLESRMWGRTPSNLLRVVGEG
jgi:hypothetical protein